MKPVILYSKPGCHLCDEAFQILLNLSMAYPLAIDWVDITLDRDIEARYFLRIPVLGLPDDSRELDWPFDRDDVLRFLEPAEQGRAKG